MADGAAAVRRAFKFRAYPTRPQEGRAAHLLADHCDLYNAALEERREAWRMRRVSVSYGMQSAQLRDIRRADPQGQGRHSFSAQQQTLRRLNTVFATFYMRAKNGKAGYPRFKPYSRFHQVRFVADDGAKWIPADCGGWARAAFRGVGSVKVRQHRSVSGIVKTLQLKREHRRWYVIVTADAAPSPLPPGGRSVGADLGIARFLTTSDGQVIPNPRFLGTSAETIAHRESRAQQVDP
jgi:putative transposase